MLDANRVDSSNDLDNVLRVRIARLRWLLKILLALPLLGLQAVRFVNELGERQSFVVFESLIAAYTNLICVPFIFDRVSGLL